MVQTQIRGSWRVAATLGALVFAGAGCSALNDDVDGFSGEEWKAIAACAPLASPMPPNPFNRQHDDELVARLGQMFFFDKDSAEPLPADGPLGKKGEVGKHSCVTCHDPNRSFVDSRPGPLSIGRSGTASRRHTPPLVNIGWYDWAGWAGRFDSLVMHGAAASESQGSRLGFAHYVYRKYRDEYNAAFPLTPLDPALDPAAPDAARFPATGRPKANAQAPDGPWEAMTPADQKIILQFMANVGRTYDAYPRKLVTRDSPFERYVNGDHGAISAVAKEGLRLFIGKAGCNDCHSGPILSDNRFHNIGVPAPAGETTPDLGRFADMPGTLSSLFNGAGEYSDDPEAGRRKHLTMNLTDDAMKGAFRTPSLLNIADTAPYFHTGLARTLEEVVRHYNRGGGEPGTFSGPKDARLKPLYLTDMEIAALVEFMQTLTGQVDPQWTEDIAKHDPR
jgi:cytochrome c peroxidase